MLRSSARDNRLARLIKKITKPRKIKAFRGFLIPKRVTKLSNNQISDLSPLQNLTKSLLEEKERDSEDNYTGRTWLDTEKFITSATGNVVPAWQRERSKSTVYSIRSAGKQVFYSSKESKCRYCIFKH